MPKGTQLSLTPEMRREKQINEMAALEKQVRNIRNRICKADIPAGLDSELMDSATSLIRKIAGHRESLEKFGGPEPVEPKDEQQDGAGGDPLAP